MKCWASKYSHVSCVGRLGLSSCVKQQPPSCSHWPLNKLCGAFLVLSTVPPLNTHLFLCENGPWEKKKKKATCECCRLVCKLGDSWKSCSVALTLLMSMCLIYNQLFVCWPRHPRKQNNGFQLWRLLLGNHVGFCGFGTGPNICRVKCSLGDSDVQSRWKTMAIDYSIQIKGFRENTRLLRVFPQEQVQGLF